MAWPKSGPNHKPASGIPAKGVGKGDGWGGPPKGAGKVTPRENFPGPKSKDPVKTARRKLVKKARMARIEQLTDHLSDLALNAAREETQVSATIAALNRLDGLPVATQKNLNVETTLADLVKDAAKLRGKPAV